MSGPNLFAELIKRGEIHDASNAASSPEGAREFMKASYPMVKTTDVYETGHDTAPAVDALGRMSGDASGQDDSDIDTVAVDATTFDEKVRQLVESVGAAYNYKAARQTGLIKRLDPEVVAAVQRLNKNAALLNKAVRITNLRRTEQNRPPIGSASVSEFGSGRRWH